MLVRSRRPAAGAGPARPAEVAAVQDDIDGHAHQPVRGDPAANGAASSLTVDQGTSLSQLASVAFALKNPVTTMVPFGGFGNTSAGSVVEWNVPEAKVFFNDLATDKPLPKNLITGASVAGTS